MKPEAPGGLYFTSRTRDTRRVLKDSFNFQGKVSLGFFNFSNRFKQMKKHVRFDILAPAPSYLMKCH